jgi:hypothetical protein
MVEIAKVTRLATVAPLRNVLLMRRMMEHLIGRSPNLPGIGVFYGQAGLGKSNACAAATTAHRGIYVELRAHFTRKVLLQAMLHEMGIKPERTTAELFDQVCEELLLSKKPLILDMGDYLIKRNLVDLVLDIYEASRAAIALIGEERFASALKRASERVYDRVLEWQPAQLADMDDARKLAMLYAPEVDIRDDLLGAILRDSRGVARKIATNLDAVGQEAKKIGKRSMDLKTWGERPLYTGEPPIEIRRGLGRPSGT